MLRFKQFILEYLTPEEKEQVSTWDKRTPEASKATDHFFGVGNDEHHEPLVNTAEKSEVHRAIEKHIGRDISHEDYKSGMTREENGKQTRIPQLITDPTLKTQFKTDNSRKNVKANVLSVRTTRSPEGIAGQTSRGQSWENASCKNFNTGCNRHYLPAEVKHGTVVSYLHDHEGKEIARATFQPHINSEGNTVYVRDSYYGTRHPEFERHNREMERRLSRPHRGSDIYTKHREVYNDSGIYRVMHPEKRKEYAEELTKKIKAGTHTSDDLNHATDNDYLTDEHKKLLPGAFTKKLQAGTHTIDDFWHANENGYFNDEHKNLLPGALTKKIKAGTHTSDDLWDARSLGYLNDDHRRLLDKHLADKIKAGDHTNTDVAYAKDYEYYKEHTQRALANHPETGEGLLREISKKSTDPETHKAVANHKNVTADSLGIIASRSNHPEVHKALIDNNKTEDSDLHEISKKSTDPEVHKKLLQRGGGVHKPYIINQILHKYNRGYVYVRPEDGESMANKYVNDALEKKNRWDKQKEVEKQQYAKRMQKPVRKSIPQNKPDITVPINARDKRFGVVESNLGK